MSDYVWSPPDFTKPADPGQPTPLDPAGAVVVPEWDPGSFGSVARADRLVDHGTEWDRIVIAGVALHAIVSVDGDKSTRFDQKMTPGVDGATTTQLGVTPAPITIRLKFMTTAGLQQWADLVKYLQPLPGKERTTPVDVDHPALAINRIHSLYLQSLGLPKPTGPGGPIEVVTRWVEFLPPKQAGFKTALGSTSTGLGSKPVAPKFKTPKPSEGATGP